MDRRSPSQRNQPLKPSEIDPKLKHVYTRRPPIPPSNLPPTSIPRQSSLVQQQQQQRRRQIISNVHTSNSSRHVSVPKGIVEQYSRKFQFFLRTIYSFLCPCSLLLPTKL